MLNMLNPGQRKLLAAKLADFGNIAASPLTFGAVASTSSHPAGALQ
jgi:hypothetical protein